MKTLVTKQARLKFAMAQIIIMRTHDKCSATHHASTDLNQEQTTALEKSTVNSKQTVNMQL